MSVRGTHSKIQFWALKWLKLISEDISEAKCICTAVMEFAYLLQGGQRLGSHLCPSQSLLGNPRLLRDGLIYVHEKYEPITPLTSPMTSELELGRFMITTQNHHFYWFWFEFLILLLVRFKPITRNRESRFAKYIESSQLYSEWSLTMSPLTLTLSQPHQNSPSFENLDLA